MTAPRGRSTATRWPPLATQGHRTATQGRGRGQGQGPGTGAGAGGGGGGGQENGQGAAGGGQPRAHSRGPGAAGLAIKQVLKRQVIEGFADFHLALQIAHPLALPVVRQQGIEVVIRHAAGGGYTLVSAVLTRGTVRGAEGPRRRTGGVPLVTGGALWRAPYETGRGH